MGIQQKQPILFLDLETWASPNKPDYPPFKVTGNATKPETIQKQKDEYELNKESLRDALWRKQALNSLKGQIIVIGYAFNDDDVTVLLSEDEEELLLTFDEALAERDDLIWVKTVAHNALRFDLPWLYHRTLKYDLPNLSTLLPSGKKDITNVIDTLSLFSYTAYGSDFWHSLDDIASFFGFPNKESQGSEIHDLWLNEEYDKIISHCKYDIELLRNIYKRTL
jgi:predicted PolB exonuclease-like 3'-5' exonuclease